SKSYSTDANQQIISNKPDKFSEKKINKAMKVYLERSREYKQFMEKQIAEYNIGKRHLAKIMGEDPDNFTEADIDRAISYLFPSGLYDKQAKPMMIDPTKMYETRKEAEFDEAGRPHHFLFYTLNPNYYEVLHPEYDSDNRPFILVEKCARKNARGQVKVIGNGSGKITINGKDITSFNDIQCREQTPSSLPAKKKVQMERVVDMEDVTASIPNTSKRITMTSLLLTRWLASKSSPPRTETETDWSSDDRSLEYGTPPPIEEPHCYSMCASESSCTELFNCINCTLQVNKNIIRNLLVEHMRYVGGRLQLLDDLEENKMDLKNPEYLVKYLKQHEINALLLHASFLGQVDAITGLHKCGADLNHSEQGKGLTPLHLCAFSNSLEGIQYLLANGANIHLERIHTPFHYAAFGNAFKVAQYFLQLGVSQKSPYGEETVLHTAAKSKAYNVLKLLAPHNHTLDNLDCNGYAAIHHIADKGDSACLMVLLDAERGANVHLKNHRDQTALHIASRSHSFECVEILLKKGGCDPNIEDSDGRTPLHLALGRSLLAYDVTELLITWKANINKTDKYGYTPLHIAALNELSQCVDVLIQHGADLSARTKVLHCAIRAGAVEIVKLLLERGASVVEKNHMGETPLHVACFIQSIKCVELLLDSAGTNINAVDRAHRTPLHFAVMTTYSSAKLVELLLNHGALVNAADKTGFTPLHVAALNEQSHCVDVLIWAGADVSATTSAGLSALNIILRKIPESLQVFRQRLDASITLRRPVPHNREFEMRLHFDLLFPSGNQCETSFINTFVQERRKDLLSHPLVMAFLHLKWEKIRKFYLLRILVYAMTVICMTTYVLTALAYKCYNYDEANSSKICSNKRISGFLFRRPVIEIQWYLLLIFTCISIPRKIFGFMVYTSAKQYFSNIDNVLDGIVIISVFVTSFVYTGRTYDWQNYVGAFAILCAWTNLMLMVGQLPAFGTYVAMFTHIQFEFAKLLLAYSGLLIGFTISFCVIFVGEPSFGNPFTGLIKVLAMMAGELDFEGLITQIDEGLDGNPEGPFVIYHPLSVCSQILFTLFIVFVTVILMNLLVGIAVHDIQGLRNHAGLTKLVRQTKLILFTEMVLHNSSIPYAFRKWMSDHKINVENRKRVLVVKPLNPLEKRLPKDILKAAYEIAQKNIPFMDDDNINLSDHVMRMRQQSEEYFDSNLQLVIENMVNKLESYEDTIKSLKEQLLDSNKMLESVVQSLTKQKNN
ncbi:Transient receptor potential channel pyrexia, partial [Melipona quadrifasciata]